MSRNIYKILFFWVIHLVLFAQLGKPTDYQKLLAIPEDTNKVWEWVKFGDWIQNENLDSAEYFYKKAFILSKKLDYWVGTALYYRTMSYYYGYRKANKNKGLYYAKIMLNEAFKRQDDLRIAKAYFFHGVVYQKAGQLDSSIFYYEKAIPGIAKVEPEQLANLYHNIAGIYDELRMIPVGWQYAQKAEDLYKKNNDTTGFISAILMKANLVAHSNNKTRLKELLNESIRLSKLIKHDLFLSLGYSGLASLTNQKLDSAIYYYKESIKFAKQSDSRVDVFTKRLSLCDIYLRNNDLKNAAKILFESMQDTSKLELSLSERALSANVRFKVFGQLGKLKEANNFPAR
jgi:two-component system, NarL family, sensor kinase